MNWHYTTVQFQPMRDLDLSILEYIIADLTYHQSDSGNKWWAYSPAMIADLVGMSERAIRYAVDRCKEKGVLEHDGDKLLSCQKFIDMVYPRNGNNFRPNGKNDRLQTAKTAAHYNNIYINKDIYIEKVDSEGNPKKLKIARGALEGFPLFKESYPRNEDMVSASAEWRKLTADEKSLVLLDIPKRKESEMWVKEDGRYIPLAKTYLKNRRWEDDIKSSKPNVYVA